MNEYFELSRGLHGDVALQERLNMNEKKMGKGMKVR